MRGATKRAAAIEAGYSERSAHVQASELLQRPTVRARLEAFYKRDEAEVLASREVIRQLMFEQAVACPDDIFDDDWEIRPKRDIPAAVRSLVLSVRKFDSPDQGSSLTVKLLNLETIRRSYLKLFAAPASQAESLEDAAAAVEQEMDVLFARMDEPDEDELEPDEDE
mgnify:CR=1 FL=1